jgi:hypothetical protein
MPAQVQSVEGEAIGLLNILVATSDTFSGPGGWFDMSASGARTAVIQALTMRGGRSVGLAFLGWAETAADPGHAKITAALLYPERYEDHGSRWFTVNQTAQRTEALDRLDRLYPPPTAPSAAPIGFHRP